MLALRELLEEDLAEANRLSQEEGCLVALGRVPDQGVGLVVLVAVLVVDGDELLSALPVALGVTGTPSLEVGHPLLPADTGQEPRDRLAELVRLLVLVDLEGLELLGPVLEVVGGLDLLLRRVALLGPVDRQDVQEHLGTPRGVDAAVKLDDDLLREGLGLLELVVDHHELRPVIHDLGQLLVVLLLHVLLIDLVRGEHRLLVVGVLSL